MILYHVLHLPVILHFYYILLFSDCQLLFSDNEYADTMISDSQIPDSFH